MNGFFVTIPHSGEQIPAETPWLKTLPEPVVMCDVDRFVDQLYEPSLKKLKIPFIITPWHRYVVDLNRLPDDVDASTVQNHPTPAGKFARGLHWKHTTKKQVLMPEPMTPELHQKLVLSYFEPFHDQVRAEAQRWKNQGAAAIYHLDLHSMPSRGTSEHKDPGQDRADIVISDSNGKSSVSSFKDLVIAAYRDQGFSIAYNWPYVGGRITETYGHPSRGHHAVQVELNRKLYMDEETKRARPELWPELQERLGQALARVQEGVQALE